MKDQSAIQTYMECLNKKDHTLFRNMEAFARDEGVPIMEKDAMEVVLQLLQVHDSRRILEIGTAIGYSALRMASALPEAHVISVEKDETSYERALEFREKSGLASRTSFHKGDALERVPILDEEDAFDVLFIDAAKGKYRNFFDTYFPYVKHNGLVISDNVFFKGLAAEPEKASGRLRPMVDKIRSFNEYLCSHPEVETSFLPVGDGVAVSRKT
ncbi:O-methyltransferase [Salibacterium halotolerans]|nr:O-methyltransferase [Salibacterium halotolerans]